jgi:hypothetical protein
MPSVADRAQNLRQVAYEFFEYIDHLKDIQEPDCYVADMTEKELREKVSHERTIFGEYNPAFVHAEVSYEDFMSIGEMGHEEEESPDDFVEIEIDNSWNVVNNQILTNSLKFDSNALSQIDVIASTYAQTPPTEITAQSIAIASKKVKGKEFFSFTEANDVKSDTSKFNINSSIVMEQRYNLFMN